MLRRNEHGNRHFQRALWETLSGEHPSGHSPRLNIDRYILERRELSLGASGIGPVQRCSLLTRSSPRSRNRALFPRSRGRYRRLPRHPNHHGRRPRLPPITPDRERPITTTQGEEMPQRRTSEQPSTASGLYVLDVSTARPWLPACNIMRLAKLHHYAVPEREEGFLESRWPAQTDADDCRKTEWGSILFHFSEQHRVLVCAR
jgi:hypothetical protein